MACYFVTGANSFLGGTLVPQLLAAGHEVRALIRPGSNDILLRDLPIQRIPGDLLRPASYAAALPGCDGLFHVAASFTTDPAQVAQMEKVNVEGTRLVLTAALAAGIPRLLHTSTIGTLGQPTDGNPAGSLATEKNPFNLADPSPYVRSKLAGEQIADELAQTGAHIVIVHPVAMLGPGDWRPSNSGRFVLDVLAGRTPNYAAGGINWAPVSDVAQGLIRALERGIPGRRYILGHRHGNLSRDEFTQLIQQAAGLPRHALKSRLRSFLRPRQPAAPAAQTSPNRLTCDPSRAIDELGLPQTDLLAAARAEVNWYRTHGYV